MDDGCAFEQESAFELDDGCAFDGFGCFGVLWSAFAKSAFTDLGLFLSDLGLYARGKMCMFSKTQVQLAVLTKKRKVLSKIRRLQKVLSNIASLQGCFLKNEGFFQIYEAYRRFNCCQLTVSKEQKLLSNLRNLQEVQLLSTHSFERMKSSFKLTKSTGGPGEKCFQT